MKKRLIAFLLVLIMVLGMLPVSALAADGDATRYTYHLIHEFNYVGGTRWDIQATTAAESYQIDVNKGKPTRSLAGQTMRMLRLCSTMAATRLR